jgi:hypothetical protein
MAAALPVAPSRSSWQSCWLALARAVPCTYQVVSNLKLRPCQCLQFPMPAGPGSESENWNRPAQALLLRARLRGATCSGRPAVTTGHLGRPPAAAQAGRDCTPTVTSLRICRPGGSRADVGPIALATVLQWQPSRTLSDVDRRGSTAPRMVSDAQSAVVVNRR